MEVAINFSLNHPPKRTINLESKLAMPLFFLFFRTAVWHVPVILGSIFPSLFLNKCLELSRPLEFLVFLNNFTLPYFRFFKIIRLFPLFCSLFLFFLVLR
nr:hypothetical protein Iba_scaffold19743CG0050 [Ipomoea batatas]